MRENTTHTSVIGFPIDVLKDEVNEWIHYIIPIIILILVLVTMLFAVFRYKRKRKYI